MNQTDPSHGRGEALIAHRDAPTHREVSQLSVGIRGDRVRNSTAKDGASGQSPAFDQPFSIPNSLTVLSRIEPPAPEDVFCGELG